MGNWALAVLAAVLVGREEPPPSFALEWEAPSECPTREDVVVRVEALVGQTVSPAANADRIAFASVARRDDDRWVLRIETRTAQGLAERELVHAGSCATMADAAATMVAIALDPRGLGATEPEPEPAPEPVVEAAAAVDPTPSPSPAASPQTRRERAARRRRQRRARPRRTRSRRGSRELPPAIGTTGVLAGMGFGALPRLNAVLGGTFGVLLPRLRIAATGVYWLPSALRFAELPEAGADFQLWHGGIEAGPRIVLSSRLELDAMAGFEIGQLRGRPVRLTTPQTQTDVWVALPVGGGLAYSPIPWLALRVGLRTAVPLRRPRFVARDYGQLHRPTPVVVRLVAGVEFRFR
ncbi:MAG: hypothetical protein AAF721_13285 [Myxococcota bacterium]